jgi:F0F1-type ATP synthase assembly protein I
MADSGSTPRGRDKGPNSLRGAGDYIGVGLQFAGAIVLFLFVGQWLDRRLGTEPWLLFLGVFVGATAGFYSLYRQLVIGPRERGKRSDG